MSHVAFITCENKPRLTADDAVLAGALGKMGHTVTAVPWSSPANWSTFDMIIIRSTWDYHLRAEEFATWVKGLQIANVNVCNPADLLLWNMHKRYLLELRGKGIQIPPTVMSTGKSWFSLRDMLVTNGWTRAVIKPAVSATAYATWVTSLETAGIDQEKFNEQCHAGDVLVQAFLQEISRDGELSLIYFNNEFSHAVCKRAKEGDFRVQNDFGGRSEKIDVSPRIIAHGKKIIQHAPNVPMYARVDGVMVNGEFVLMELELIEPHLFFSEGGDAAETLASGVHRALTSRGRSQVVKNSYAV